MIRLSITHFLNILFHILTTKQVIESVSGYCLHHQALTSREVRIILQRWAKHESNTIFVNRLIPNLLYKDEMVSVCLSVHHAAYSVISACSALKFVSVIAET